MKALSYCALVVSSLTFVLALRLYGQAGDIVKMTVYAAVFYLGWACLIACSVLLIVTLGLGARSPARLDQLRRYRAVHGLGAILSALALLLLQQAP